MPRDFPKHYLSALAFPKRENPLEKCGSSSEQGPLPIIGPHPTFDETMNEASASSASFHNFHYGINGINNLISQMPD